MGEAADDYLDSMMRRAEESYDLDHHNLEMVFIRANSMGQSPPGSGYWRSADRELHAIKDMTDSHLVNTEAHCRRHGMTAKADEMQKEITRRFKKNQPQRKPAPKLFPKPTHFVGSGHAK